MKEIAIYIEGGGDTCQYQVELRNGFDLLLRRQKESARKKRLGWKLVPCGGRGQTYEAFIHKHQIAGESTLTVLLVDSEDGLAPESKKPAKESTKASRQRRLVDAADRKQHLVRREKWNLGGISAEHVHLMVQCMEAWIVADADALIRWYGQGFNARKLPLGRNLENEPKRQLYAQLENATKGTSKGAYAKIKHGSKLLGLVDPAKVAKRCPRFATFVGWLEDLISEA